jgi:hypothetical protein
MFYPEEGESMQLFARANQTLQAHLTHRGHVRQARRCWAHVKGDKATHPELALLVALHREGVRAKEISVDLTEAAFERTLFSRLDHAA